MKIESEKNEKKKKLTKHHLKKIANPGHRQGCVAFAIPRLMAEA
jgi:hypothetical protein